MTRAKLRVLSIDVVVSCSWGDKKFVWSAGGMMTAGFIRVFPGVKGVRAVP